MWTCIEFVMISTMTCHCVFWCPSDWPISNLILDNELSPPCYPLQGFLLQFLDKFTKIKEIHQHIELERFHNIWDLKVHSSEQVVQSPPQLLPLDQDWGPGNGRNKSTCFIISLLKFWNTSIYLGLNLSRNKTILYLTIQPNWFSVLGGDLELKSSWVQPYKQFPTCKNPHDS